MPIGFRRIRDSEIGRFEFLKLAWWRLMRRLISSPIEAGVLRWGGVGSTALDSGNRATLGVSFLSQVRLRLIGLLSFCFPDIQQFANDLFNSRVIFIQVKDFV